MAEQDRAETHALTVCRALEQAPYKHDFFAAVRRLECAFRDKPRVGRSARPSDEPVRLAQDPTLAFAPASLSSFRQGKNGRPPRLAGYFFGLTGPNGPLPIHLTEYAYDRLRNAHDPTFSGFLDVFHHRMLSLFYRAWANARPTVSFDRPEADWFGDQLGALCGVGMPTLRDRDEMPDVAKLYFAGFLACENRHPEGLCAIIADFFKFPARVMDFIGAWLQLPKDDCCQLGRSPATGTLGVNAIAGTQVWGCQHKFRLVLGPMDFADFQRLLPGSESFGRLLAIVHNYTGHELAWDVNMILKRDEVPRLRLGESGRLGWTTWLGNRRATKDADDLILDALAYETRNSRRTDAEPKRETTILETRMPEISRVALFGKLNPIGYKAIESATVFCKMRGNPYVELVHWIHQILQLPDSDLHRILKQFDLNPSRLAQDVTEALDRLPRGSTSISDLSAHVEEAVERGWVYATLLFGESQVRSGYLVFGILRHPVCARPASTLR